MLGIAILASGGTNWIGGIYYAKNIAFQLALNGELVSAYRIYLCVPREYVKEFDGLPSSVKVVPMRCLHGITGKIHKLLFCLTHRIKFVLYCSSELLRFFGITGISWIPDFQDKRIPEFFSEYELQARDKAHKRIAVSSSPLVLSSRDALRDFREFYGKEKKNVIVFPFVSYIEPILNKLNPSLEDQIIKNHGLEGVRYACVMNQFWQHKNHMVVIEALKTYYHNNPDSKLVVVFTGRLYEYRKPEYIQKLKEMLQHPSLLKHIRLLGFIEREDQLVIMKHSEFVIQPSLFEGWGTVLEDAKVLDKTVLLSDIPVHREQMNSKCVLFDPHNPLELAKLIAQESTKPHNDDQEKGIADMYKRAKEYSANFWLEGMTKCLK